MSPPRVRPIHRLEAAAVEVLAALAMALPRRGALRLGRAVGTLVRLLGVRRAVSRENLRRAFPEKSAREREAIRRAAYAHAGMAAIELLRAPRLDAAARAELVASVHGLEHVAAARAGGRGAVLMTGHFGAFELVGAAVAAAGHPIHFFVRAQSNPLVDRIVTARRRALGVGIVGHGGRGVRDALAILRRGECLAVLADQDAGVDGVFVPFFGRSTSTPPGPAEFSLRTGAPIVFGALRRTSGGGYAGEIDPPLELPKSGDHAGDVRELTRRHAAALEEVIRACPEQWLWTHRRWKTAPPKAPARTIRPALALACALALALAAPAVARAAADSTAARPAPPPESTFDGAGSTVFPLEHARVRRLFEDVRLLRRPDGWEIVVDEWFEAGVAPATAVFGLPDYRASLAGSGDSSVVRGTLRDLEVTVDGLPMAVEALPGNAAPGADLGGIERILRFQVPFSAEEKRGVRLVYRIGESRTDGGEPLLFYYRNPGSLWEGESPKSTVRVDLGDLSADDLVIGWLRPRGYRLYGSSIFWHRPAGEELADIALGARPLGDPLAAFPDRRRGPLGLGPEAREEWFDRLTANEIRFYLAWLAVRRGAPPPAEGPGSTLAAEKELRPARETREEKWPEDERRLRDRLAERLDRWERTRIPYFAGPPFLPAEETAP